MKLVNNKTRLKRHEERDREKKDAKKDEKFDQMKFATTRGPFNSIFVEIAVFLIQFPFSH